MDFARGIPFRAGLIVAALTARGPQDAQAPKAPAADDLHAAVELCFSTVDDAKATEQIDDTVAKFGADPAALLKAVGTPPPKPSGDSLTLRVPFRGQALVATVALPKNAAGAPPVVADISGDTGEKTFHWTTAASCRVSGYTPPHLTDECRDSFGKVLHAVSFAVGGDPDRLWMTGMSWGGHAAFDIASHRPGLLRGFVSLAGGPRRNHFRLFKNYGATSITALVGAKDDPDVVWNLEEMGRGAKGLGLDWHFTLDPEGGHKLPLAGMDDVAARVDTTAALPAKIPDHGTLLADADLVALPWLEVVEVDPAAVAVPDKFPVDGSLSMDEKRRAMVKSMSGQFAKVDWKLTKEKDGDGVALELSAKGVKRAAVLVKAPWFDLGRPLKVVVNKKKFCEGAIAVDPATVLKEARRTGDRQRPTVMRVEVKF